MVNINISHKPMGYKQHRDLFWYFVVALLVVLFVIAILKYDSTKNLSQKKMESNYFIVTPIISLLIAISAFAFISPIHLSKFTEQNYKILNYFLFVINLLILVLIYRNSNPLLTICMFLIICLYIVIIYLQGHNQANDINCLFCISNLIMLISSLVIFVS